MIQFVVSLFLYDAKPKSTALRRQAKGLSVLLLRIPLKSGTTNIQARSASAQASGERFWVCPVNGSGETILVSFLIATFNIEFANTTKYCQESGWHTSRRMCFSGTKASRRRGRANCKPIQTLPSERSNRDRTGLALGSDAGADERIARRGAFLAYGGDRTIIAP